MKESGLFCVFRDSTEGTKAHQPALSQGHHNVSAAARQRGRSGERLRVGGEQGSLGLGLESYLLRRMPETGSLHLSQVLHKFRDKWGKASNACPSAPLPKPTRSVPIGRLAQRGERHISGYVLSWVVKHQPTSTSDLKVILQQRQAGFYLFNHKPLKDWAMPHL